MFSREPKRVLISAPLYANGGIESHLFNLCRLLVEYGAEVTLVSRYAQAKIGFVDQHRQIPIRFYTTPFAESGGRLSTLWAALCWPARLFPRFDVLYTLDLSPFVNFLSLFLKPGAYLIGGRAGTVPANPDFIPPHVQKRLNGFLVESAVQASQYRLGVPIAVIPHLAHVQSVAARERRASHELGIAFLGRLHRDKGLFRLLDVWPTLNIQPARLDFYGDGPERAALEQAIRDRSLSSAVAVHGSFQPDKLATIFDCTDLLVLPSYGEGLPLVLMESMAHGVPFVATDVGGVSALAQDNPDVCVVPLDDTALKLGIERMAQAIRSGQIDGQRLQEYHRARYGYDRLASRWLEALLHPQDFWKNGLGLQQEPRTRSAANAQEPSSASVLRQGA